MSECRKVQELTKEFLKKLLKVKKFKEMVISNKINNKNFESKRIRIKNINSNSYNDANLYLPFSSLSDGVKTNHRNKPLKKIPPIISPLRMHNDNSKEKESIATIKVSQKKLPKIEKPKTSDKFKEKEKMSIKFKKLEEKKNDTKVNNSNDVQMKFKSKEEPIKKKIPI